MYGDNTSALNTTILGASKLTGRVGKGMSLAFLDAVTQREVGTEDRTIEPFTNYAVARLQQDLRDGQTGIGVMVTGVNRNLDDDTEMFLRRSAYTGGIDVRHRFFNRNYELRAYVAASQVNGTADAIRSTQLDGVHRYQRPDDDVEVDPTRTSLTGNAQRLTVSKFGGGITRFQSVLQRFSPGFETNDLGFQSRADEQMFRNWFSLNFNKPNSVFQRAFFNFNTMQRWTTEGLATNTNLNTNWHVQFKNFFWGHFGGNISNLGETYNDRVARGGPALRNSRQGELWGGIETDTRKAYTGFLYTGRWGGDDGNSNSQWVDVGGSFRVGSQFSVSLSGNYSDNLYDAQWRQNFGVAGVDTTHYTFARLDQKTLSITSRINFTATPTLSLQFWGQPFISRGKYSNWRELAEPRADEYEDRFAPYAGDPGGFDVKQFRSNTVLRWEWRPGSTMFLVWQQGRQLDGGANNDFNFGRDLRSVFDTHPNSTFLVNVSYWFNP